MKQTGALRNAFRGVCNGEQKKKEIDLKVSKEVVGRPARHMGLATARSRIELEARGGEGG